MIGWQAPQLAAEVGATDALMLVRRLADRVAASLSEEIEARRLADDSVGVAGVPLERDPLEQELPEIGMLTLRDAETGETLLIDTHDKRFRQRFAQLAAEREAALREELARAGVDTLELRTDDDLLDALLRFADLRKRRVSGRGITQVLRKSA